MGARGAWPRFAVAFNWCQWAIPVLAVVLLLVLAGVLMAARLPNDWPSAGRGGWAATGFGCIGSWRGALDLGQPGPCGWW